MTARPIATLVPLIGVEARLQSREWAPMLFAFLFPPLMLVVLAGVFGTRPDEGFGGAVPSEYYVAAYLGVPLGALALVGLPVVLASYRERDVLRRFEASGVPTASLVTAQAAVTAALVVAGAGVLLAVAAPTYGIPAIQDVAGTVAGFAVGTVTMLAVGLALGLAAPTARAAQALGLLTFLPMWLLGGGGPPREVMSEPMRVVSDLLPLTHVTAAIREPWLGTGSAGPHLLVLAAWLVGSVLVAALLLRRRVL